VSVIRSVGLTHWACSARLVLKEKGALRPPFSMI
jgi:hypothetical protein